MRKLLLLIFAAFLLVLPTNAKKPQLARSVWFLFEKQENMEKQPNDSVMVTYKTVMKSIYPNDQNYSTWYPQPVIVMTIQNKCERGIYVDLQQSFIVINEELYPLYIPTSEIQATSNTSMVGVNLGLVGVGSAGTTSTAKITHAERYITVPGETKKSVEVPLTKWEVSFHLNSVDAWLEIKPSGSNGVTDSHQRDYVATRHRFLQYFINYGEVKNYDYDDNPFTLDMRVCYSFNSNMTPNYTNRSVYYTAHLVGSDYVKGGRYLNDADIERAKEIYPPLNDYVNSSKSFYFHFWSPEIMPKK